MKLYTGKVISNRINSSVDAEAIEAMTIPSIAEFIANKRGIELAPEPTNAVDAMRIPSTLEYIKRKQ